MKIKYKEPKDKRVNAKHSFWKEYIVILGTVLLCCSGAVLINDAYMAEQANPWSMVLGIGSYLAMICFIVSGVIRWIKYTAYTKPMGKIGQAARKVAVGDFTVRIASERKDGKKDEMELLIDDFNKMVEELATIETLKGDFISNISHEIKTPLSVIQSYATVLHNGNISGERRQEYLETILESTRKLSALITNILRLNKLENQEIIHGETYSLDEQLRCCILALEEKFEEKSIEFDANLEEVVITTDESLLEIVWNNLLTNAIKFTEPGGSVMVNLKVENDIAIVSISDSGCGMDEKTIHSIFDRFYQGDTSHSREGYGLGLALVKRIIALVDGNITVESKLGNGTIFMVTIKL
ncbi:HAMP domain-containing sensor histidine kinase [Clostridium kluyveri]|uniref:histidine kinase n=1 Tax=Clostridium kluyveri TaxID=1534 RepID=A0A1L5F4J8_CLOKL|nr:HAMP domain-containing sensor histidine kinase [Clostridium kluyveri]APM37897.1 two-component sensor histidine kinase [Clostridium kluyveri]UZQ52098.1 HAMP domain-containing histidine kinase [Clostridium kluyveri]